MVLCGGLCGWQPASDRSDLLDARGMSFDCRCWLILLGFGCDVVPDVDLWNRRGVRVERMAVVRAHTQ